jgi:hypothetical protein
VVRGRGEEKLILAEHGRKVHQLLGDFTLFKQRLQVLEERVAQLESCLVKLMKTLSESEE